MDDLTDMSKIRSFFSRFTAGMTLTRFSVLMSVVNLVLFNIPFFKFVAENVENRGTFIIVSLVLLMLVANFFATYLFCFLCRGIGKGLVSLTFILSAACVWFINVYSVMMDETMLGNVFNTKYSEASGFFSWGLILQVLALGVLPTIYIFKVKLDYGSWKKFGRTVGYSLLAILVIIGVNMNNFLWIGKYDSELGGLLMPWSYTVNTARHINIKHQENKQEILLPDATIRDSEKSVVVLVIGESARRENFSLYGYGRNTNPLLSQIEDLHIYKADSYATYTTGSVKAILEYEATGTLYEILPNYICRNGGDVCWRTSNWGEPPVHVPDYVTDTELKEEYGGEDGDYDGILLCGLKERILSSDRDKILIVLHTSTSHGPLYSKKYPPRFEVFTPVCESVEASDDDIEGLINAYDNSIVYTDYLLNEIISTLKELDSFHSTVIYVSDHGESLGENGLYMHGVPVKMAPKEQYEIPFIVWTSDDFRQLKPLEEASQHQVFHSVLNFLSFDSPVYDPEMSIFE